MILKNRGVRNAGISVCFCHNRSSVFIDVFFQIRIFSTATLSSIAAKNKKRIMSIKTGRNTQQHFALCGNF